MRLRKCAAAYKDYQIVDSLPPRGSPVNKGMIIEIFRAPLVLTYCAPEFLQTFFFGNPIWSKIKKIKTRNWQDGTHSRFKTSTMDASIPITLSQSSILRHIQELRGSINFRSYAVLVNFRFLHKKRSSLASPLGTLAFRRSLTFTKFSWGKIKSGLSGTV